MIDRVGALCRAKGWTLCKGARAGHDRRSDVPTVGATTIEKLYAAGGRCLPGRQQVRVVTHFEHVVGGAEAQMFEGGLERTRAGAPEAGADDVEGHSARPS